MDSLIHIDEYKIFDKSNDSSSITLTSLSGSYLSLINQSSFYPFIYDLQNKSLIQFKGKAKNIQKPTAIDISFDKQFVVTGHEDGSIFLWSTTKNFSLIKDFKKNHKSSITFVGFCKNGDLPAIIAVDSNGLITYIVFSITLGITIFQESIIYDSGKTVKQLVTSKQNAPFQIGFLVFENYYIKFYNDDSKWVFEQSENFEQQPTLSLYQRNVDFFFTVVSGSNISIYQLVSKKDKYSFLSTQEKNGNIVYLNYLSPTLLVYQTVDGHMTMMNTKGDIIYQYKYDKFAELYKNTLYVNSFNEKLLFITNDSYYTFSFVQWEELINKMADDNKYTKAFGSLSEIYFGLNQSFIGVPSNSSRKRMKVLELAKKLYINYFLKAFEKEDKETILKELTFIVFGAISLDLTEFFATNIYDMFLSKNLIDVYYEGILNGSGNRFTEFCTKDYLSKYFSYLKEHNDLERVENILLKFEFNKAQAKKILPVLVEYGLLNLYRKLCGDDVEQILLLCSLFKDKKDLSEFIYQLFSKEESCKNKNILRLMVIIWLFIPNENGEYLRLKDFIFYNLEKSTRYIKTLLSILPIQISSNEYLTINTVVDAFLQIFSDKEYEPIEQMLNIIIPYIYNSQIDFNSYSLNHVVRWIFMSNNSVEIREMILNKFLSQFPDVIPNYKLDKWCESAGFIHYILKNYESKKQYDRIVTNMILHDEQKANIFTYLEQNIKDINEIKNAIISNISALILIYPIKTTSFIQQYFPTIHEQLIEILPPKEKLIYLKYLLELLDINSIKPSWFMLTFQLMIQYTPSSSAQFLNKYINHIDLDEAANISVKNDRIDCQIQIKIARQQYQEAVEQIGMEIQRTLLSYIESESTTEINTIDDLNSIEEVHEPMAAIKTSLQLLETITTKKELQCQRMYLYFQFPLYHSKFAKPNITKAVIFMFTYFVVESLNIITARHAFCILSIHFSALEKNHYRDVLNNILTRINYQKNLSKGLIEMLMNDCIGLIDKVYLESTKGIRVSLCHCGICQNSLKKSGEKFTIYPCGHCFHNRCVKDTSKCPICTGDSSEITNDYVTSNEPNQLSIRKVQQSMRRMEFLLRKNNEMKENSGRFQSIFFNQQQEEQENVENTITLQEMIPPAQFFTISKN